MMCIILIRCAVSFYAGLTIFKMEERLEALYFDCMNIISLHKVIFSGSNHFDTETNIIHSKSLSHDYKFALPFMHEYGHAIDFQRRPLIYNVRSYLGSYVLKIAIYVQYIFFVNHLHFYLLVAIDLASSFVVLSTEYKASKYARNVLKGYGATRKRIIDKYYIFSLLTYI